MPQRQPDGSAGDTNYAKIGVSYSRYRQPDPNIAATIHAALGNAQSILNIGAGAGSYEPTDKQVTPVEPSASMRAQRPAHLPAAIDAVAENLPFPDNHFDAAMATFTIHQWPNLAAGLSEIRRVTRGPIAILTCDPTEVEKFWLNDYAPQVLATEAHRYPSLQNIAAALTGTTEVLSVPVPLHCKDGFNEAYYGRPEFLLEEPARSACSAWSFIDPATSEAYIAHLRRDLHDGTWDQHDGHLRTQPQFDGSLKLLVFRR